jgi:phage/plasmid-like protein (TIGR03299 family)
MAHELDIKSNGQAAMAYACEKPWHGLGQILSGNASLEEWQQEAGMNWNAVAAPVLYQAGGKTYRQNAKNVIYRDDTNMPLSIVSNKYKIVQPSEVMEFFRDLTADAGFRMETAGCLFGGKKLWAMAKTGKSAMIKGVDEIKPYLLLGTSMDGTMATSAHFTSVRVVCNNTLRMAIGKNGGAAQIKVPHLSEFNVEAVKEELGLAESAWDSFIDEANALASIKLCRNDEAISIVAKALKDEWLTLDMKGMSPPEMIESSRELKSIINLYDGAGIGSNLITAKGTGWGLINAVTQYYDHDVVRNSANASRSVDRAQFGDRAKIKTDIANRILELA